MVRPLLVVYLLSLAVVVLSPTSAVQSAVVSEVVARLTQLGASERLVTDARMESVFNVLMVVPAGTLGALAFRRSRWQDWAAYGLLGALAVELTQGMLLPSRSASGTDVVANALGLLVGALLVAIVCPRRG